MSTSRMAALVLTNDQSSDNETEIFKGSTGSQRGTEIGRRSGVTRVWEVDLVLKLEDAVQGSVFGHNDVMRPVVPPER